MKKETEREKALKNYTVGKLDCKALSDLLEKDLKEVNYHKILRLKSTITKKFVEQTF